MTFTEAMKKAQLAKIEVKKKRLNLQVDEFEVRKLDMEVELENMRERIENVKLETSKCEEEYKEILNKQTE